MIDNQEEKLENRYEIFDNHIYDINVNLCSFLFYDFINGHLKFDVYLVRF